MIRFGTSGWRAVLGEEFTFPNARRVVSAIARAELALQTTMAVRDRFVQAYQDIMRMPI